MADRPTFDAICEAVAKGTLTQVACADNEISVPSFHRWLDEMGPDWKELYARARVQQCHAFAEQTIAIADGSDVESQQRLTAMIEEIEEVDENDKEHVIRSLQHAAVQRDKLRLDARKWFTSKIAPKIYGDKLDVTSGGEKIGLEAVIAGSMGKHTTVGE